MEPIRISRNTNTFDAFYVAFQFKHWNNFQGCNNFFPNFKYTTMPFINKVLELL